MFEGSHRIHVWYIYLLYHKKQPNVGKYTIHGSYGDGRWYDSSVSCCFRVRWHIRGFAFWLTRSFLTWVRQDMTVDGKYTNVFFSGALDLYGSIDGIWHNYIFACLEDSGFCAGISDAANTSLICSNLRSEKYVLETNSLYWPGNCIILWTISFRQIAWLQVLRHQ